MLKEMKVEVFGKWILAGEHAVLRGCPALVFPVFGKSLKLSYTPDGQSARADFCGELGEELRLLFWSVFERGLELTGRERVEARGHFVLENTVPVGAGLGASAALSVGLGHWFVQQGWVEENDLYEFARSLEDMFHGESSGVDIAVAISGQGLHFERNGERYMIQPTWQPHWYLSYSGKRGVTSECVGKVKILWAEDARRAELIDHDMRDAVELAEEALRATHKSEGLEKLIFSINKARSCFEAWGLAGGEVGTHMRKLLEHGALAVKPTGSGDGGYVLSLWRGPPPLILRQQFVGLEKR